jgi:hypothetical protein
MDPQRGAGALPERQRHVSVAVAARSELELPEGDRDQKYAYTDLNQVDAWIRERVVDRTVKKRAVA